MASRRMAVQRRRIVGARHLSAWLLVAACSGEPRATSPTSRAPGSDAGGAPAALLANVAEGQVAAPTPVIRQPPTVAIVDRPIPFGDERKKLTLEYRRRHSDATATDISIAPRMVVLHYTGGSSADASWRYFSRQRVEPARKKLASAGAVNVSAHFLVDRDGTIYRLMPETLMARHCIGLNHVAIGVENVGDGDAHPLTKAQVIANIELVRYLVGKYDIEYVLGHSEYRQFEGHPLFAEREATYRNRKPDPGDEFLQQVRLGLRDLNLPLPPGP